MSQDILDSLVCPICFEYCQDVMESNCCHKLFCKKCTDPLNNACPLCRAKCTFSKSIVAQRLINMVPTECIHCKNKFNIGDIEQHENNCSEMMVKCPLCKLDLKKNEIINHLKENHEQKFKQNLNKILKFFDDDYDLSNESKSQGITIEKLINSKKNYARLGSTGKYYCGMPLDGQNCICCDGHCGPGSGCNCSSCMELDIKSRKLPKGWLVNSDGCVARKSEGNFYCGRRVMSNVRGCDGYCGPTNGPSCEACKKLDQMTKSPNGRYKNLI